jgi:hypothetical protein
MPLAGTVRVKLSSEEAGAVSVTPVIVREMLLGDLVELMLDLAGKDAARIRGLLLRGTLVSGASRYRWTGWDAGVSEIEALLASFPDPEPGRRFQAERCTHVILRGAGFKIDVLREALARKRLLRRSSFWNALMAVVDGARIEYAGYSYRERADRYRLEIPPGGRERLRSSAGLLRYSSLEAQARAGAFAAVEFLVPRL